MDRYIKLWDGIASDWRYAKSPLHFRVYIQCLIEAWHTDAREFKRGTFRTSQNKLADQTGISRPTINKLLNELSTGDNPEIEVKTKKGYASGYTEITILNYDKYQSNVKEIAGDSKSNVNQVTSNVNQVTSNVNQVTSNVNQVTSNVKELNTKEEYKKEKDKNIRIEKKEEDSNLSFSFEDLIELYPKTNSHKVETKHLFNELSSNDKEKCITFAKQLQRIWQQNGLKDKYQYMKSCHTYVEQKLFNGNPKDVLPAEVSLETIDEPTQEQLDWLEEQKNKYLTPLEKFKLKQK